MTIDYSLLDATDENKQHVILNAVTKMKMSDSKHCFNGKTLKSLRASKKSHGKKNGQQHFETCCKGIFQFGCGATHKKWMKTTQFHCQNVPQKSAHGNCMALKKLWNHPPGKH